MGPNKLKFLVINTLREYFPKSWNIYFIKKHCLNLNTPLVNDNHTECFILFQFFPIITLFLPPPTKHTDSQCYWLHTKSGINITSVHWQDSQIISRHKVEYSNNCLILYWNVLSLLYILGNGGIIAWLIQTVTKWGV